MCTCTMYVCTCMYVCMNECMYVCMYVCNVCSHYLPSKVEGINKLKKYAYESFSARVAELTHPELPIYSFEFGMGQFGHPR